MTSHTLASATHSNSQHQSVHGGTAVSSDPHDRIYPLSETMATLMDVVQELADYVPDHFDGLTGIPQIDDIVGFVGGGLISIESDTPCLDSQMALLVAAHWAQDVPVVYVTSRLSFARVGELLLSLRGGIAQHRLHNGQLTDAEWFVLSSACKRPDKQNFFVLELEEATVEELQNKLQSLGRMLVGKFFTVVLDDVLLIQNWTGSRMESYSLGRTVASRCRNLAHSLQCTLVVAVPSEIADGFVPIAEVHMRLEALSGKGKTPTFPAKALVHLSRCGFGLLGTANVDMGALHQNDA